MIKMRKMKDSGIVWIGEIPEGWSIARLSQISEIITGGTPPKNNSKSYYSVNGVMWVKPNDLNGLKEINCTKEYLTEEGCQFVKLVAPNTPLICCIGSIGKLGVSNYGVTFNQQINAILFNERVINIRFGFYSLFVQEQQHEYYSNGNVVKIINSSNHGQVVIAYPNKILQQKIADFLDKKCSEIDKLIELQESMIEKLKEYKQSVITQAVTKGLDPDVPMKESGIEWIGKIPEGWEVVRIKDIGTYRNGVIYSPEDLVDEGNGTLVLRSSNIKDGKLVLEDNVYISATINDNLMVKKGDILICSRNGSKALIGKNAIIDRDINAAFGAFMMIFRCKNPKYTYYILNSEVFAYYLGSYLTSTINQLTGKNFGNMQIIYAKDIQTQHQIADYLDKKCAEIDDLIKLKEQKIEKLKEYKKSLIYEYVTGKKEVV